MSARVTQTPHDALGLTADDLLAMYRTHPHGPAAATRRRSARTGMGRAPFVVPVSGHEGCQVGTAWAMRRAPTSGSRTTATWRVVPRRRDDPVRDLPRGVRQGRRSLLAAAGRCRRTGAPDGSASSAAPPPSPPRSRTPPGIAYAHQVPRRGRRRGVLVRRRRHQRGRLARGPELRRHPQAAGGLRLREQPVRDQRPAVQADGRGGRRRPAPRATGSPAWWSTATTSLACYGGHEARRTSGPAPASGPTLIECKTYRFLAAHLRRRRQDLPSAARRWRRPGTTTRSHVFGEYLTQPGHPRRRRAPRPLRVEIKAEIDTALAAAWDAAGPRARVARCGTSSSKARTLSPLDARRTSSPAIRDALHDEMAADDRVILLGEDVGARGGVFRITAGWMEEFGEDRVIDTPLAESGIVGDRDRHGPARPAAGGRDPVRRLHPSGVRPDRVARPRGSATGRTGSSACPLVIRAPWGGGIHGALYHSQSIEAFYAHVPGIKVVMPSTPADAAGHAPHARSATPTPCCSSSTRRPTERSRARYPTGRTRSRSGPPT